jgi:hypothetical protein
MAAPTVAELARVLGGDRVRLANALDDIYGMFEHDGDRLREMLINPDRAGRLARIGLHDPVIDLIGKKRAAVVALLGPSSMPGDLLRYEVRSGDAAIQLTVSIDDDVVSWVTVTWAQPLPAP